MNNCIHVKYIIVPKYVPKIKKIILFLSLDDFMKKNFYTLSSSNNIVPKIQRVQQTNYITDKFVNCDNMKQIF